MLCTCCLIVEWNGKEPEDVKNGFGRVLTLTLTAVVLYLLPESRVKWKKVQGVDVDEGSVRLQM